MKRNMVVLVGDHFNAAMTSPEQLFDKDMDPDRYWVGTHGQFTYGSGTCGLSVSPNRIELTVYSEEVMPDDLISATGRLLVILDSIRVAITVSGMGFNCDSVIPTTERSGTDISNSLARLDQLKKIADVSTPMTSHTSSIYNLGNILYNLRIEPENASNGRNLYVAVNGHQSVDESSSLTSKLDECDPFRNHVRSLHDNIRSTLI